ncbi:hypothetical protein HMPREF0004_3954 [Achromobacter piechaudii ATCC 43553]|uniref:Uncharacterized protein n=1 Tax=Achromobacter piechaudii ATCC 43553 TaxID=742159 RepID=D4XEQ7_9BURK|nr:hypothetical protein HMPREF0004_3954 [Achromobacter piechaudii ATCC 43553]
MRGAVGGNVISYFMPAGRLLSEWKGDGCAGGPSRRPYRAA